MLQTVNLYPQSRGVKITTGTIVDATLIQAPSSTKNQEQQRDPEMHQTRKGKDLYFGMKAHVCVDSRHKIIHSAVVTSANVLTGECCQSCCTGTKRRCGAIRLIGGRRKPSRKLRPRRKT